MKINKYKNMKTINKMTEKRAYSTPDVINIKLDNEISLILTSDTNPDADPFTSAPQYFNNDPFKSNMG